MSKLRLYVHALRNVINARMEDEMNRDLIKKNVFYGVKLFRELIDYSSYEESVSNLQFANSIKGTMALLTPIEFMNVFPIEKSYDGHKYGLKDYFYTVDYIRTLEQEEPIGESITDLLWEYLNWDVGIFAVDILGTMSDVARNEGLPSIAEQWANDIGLETHRLHVDHKGNEFLVNEQGRTQKITKPRPKHLKLVK